MLKKDIRHLMRSLVATVITVSLMTSLFPFEVIRYSRADENVTEQTEAEETIVTDETSDTENMSGSEDLISIDTIYKDKDKKTYKIKAVFGKDAGIPEDAEILVSEICDNDDYERYLADAAKAVGEDVSSISYGKLFDISIVKGKECYQPDGASVRITIELVDAKRLDDVKVVHFDAKDKAEELPSTTENKTVTFETEGFSVFSFLDFGTVSRKITADTVFENDDIILKGDLPASAIVEAEKVDVKIGGKDALLAYDINIFANADMRDLGINWQPDGKSLKVTFKSDAITSDAVDIYHMEDAGAKADLVKENVATGDNSVVFNADSFSIYAIVDHEGDDVKTPRFTIHYLAPVTDSSQESLVNGEYEYTVGPFEFINTAGDKQKTQIVRDGETLEMIANPANRPNKFFFGWYVVDLDSASGGNYTFSWTASPKQLPFEKPISVTDNGDGTFTMSWSVNGANYSETAEMDPDDYSAHIYVAPVYEDYCFVNFHELAYAVSNNSNLLTRKLVILGSDGTERVLISDVSAQATDTIRKIFRGWQYRANNTWVSLQTMDDSANPLTKYIDVTDDVDLYPYFQEGRWIYFNVGDSGNGAKYVPAQFALAEFDSEEGGASVGGEITKLPSTSRVGYDFAGWRVNTTGDPDNPNYVLVTDPDGNFLPSVDLSVNGTYEDNDGNPRTGVAYTIKNGVLTIKYPLNQLTFYAQWDEKANTHYSVVIWKQKVTDAANANNADKDYDYYILNALPTTVDSRSGLTVDQLNLAAYRSLTSNASTRADFTGFHLRTTAPVEMNTPTVAGDGSSIVNIYYDRNVHTLTFRANNQTVKTITELYEHNISAYFPIVGDNGVVYNQGERWSPSAGSSYTEVLVYLDIMPDENITFTLNTSTASEKNLYYYVEPLPGYTPSSTDRVYNGKTFVLYHHTVARYGYFTEGEDYLTLIGFTKSNAYPPQAYNANGNAVNQVWGQGSNAASIYCYYLRNSYSLEFMYKYPVAAGMEDKSVIKQDIFYDSPLSVYDHALHPEDTENAVWPADSEIPDHYEFAGWFEDELLSKPFDFSTNMPAADKIAYGKWTPVYYNVNIDPNGGTIDHINYDEPTDGGYPTFYLGGFTGANAGDSKWIAAWNANGDTVGSMPSWAATLAARGSGHNTSQSTYFSAQYGTAIGEYELERTYVEFNGENDGTKYYYVNMQHNSISGEWGLHADMRNALYLKADELEAYYKYLRAAQAWHEASRPGYYDGQVPATFEEFKELYVKKNATGYVLYQEVPSGSYAFIGWYKVNTDGTLSDVPYSFANAIEDEITLRAVWRRVGSYFIAYDPAYILELPDGTEVIINGQITEWTDPVNSNEEKYNDGALTTTLQQPTGITVNGQDAGEDYIFRGWQVVKFEGYDQNGHAVYSPLHDEYYAEPTPFTIDAADADPNGCIHMRAVYQAVNASDRRPKVANLMLNANDGFLTDGSGNAITSDADITSATGWTGTGVVVEDVSENEVVFGDMQSNNTVHVYKYAVNAGTLNAPYDVSSNYFKYPDGYLLIGFDKGSDYSLDRTGSSDDDILTGEAYIPTYAADSVISVQRTDSERLYAVWEPMVYVTFTNRTSQPVTFDLEGSGDAMSIVNEVTGVFSREKFTGTSVTLAPGESIKFVMPKGDGETFTINGTNTNTAQLLNVTSWYDGSQTAEASAGPYRSSGASYELTDELHTNIDGVHVYFDGVDTIFFDPNGGNWTDTRTGNNYQTVKNDPSLVYVDEDGIPYEPVDLTAGRTAVATEPQDPVRSGYTFIGWTQDPDVAACDPAAYTLPGTSQADGINNMAVIKNGLLWDFDTAVSAGMTLYAVWGEQVTVTFHLTNNHTWRDSDNEYFVPGNNYTHTVTLAKGDIVRMPAAPTWNTNNLFYRWVTVNSHQGQAKTIDQINNIYEFGTPVSEDLHLYTSWIQAQRIDVTVSKTVVNDDGTPLTNEQRNKEFTFTAEYTTSTYTGSAQRNSRTSWPTSVTGPATTEESQTFTLKEGESVTLPLYFVASATTVTVNNNTPRTVNLFFQSVTITEVSDPNYTITVSINGQQATVTDNGYITTLGAAPTNSNWTYTGNNTSRTYTLSGTPAYANNTEVPVAFTNTLTNTDVKVNKVVTPDDYITGDEEFTFNVTYYDRNGQDVTPAKYQGTPFVLKDGETEVLRGVPIGGKVTVVETTTGWTAVSVNDNDAADTAGKTFTLGQVPPDGGSITYTNTRDTYDIPVTNSVPGYGSKTKDFIYTATLWKGDTQVPFPAGITDATLSNGRKDLTFALKDGESYVIRDLPCGYKLVVTQTAEEDYVTTSGLAGELKTETLTYTIPSLEQEDTIEFVNTIKTGNYKITKNIQMPAGQAIPLGAQFRFTAKILKTVNSATSEPILAEVAAMAQALGATVSGDTISFTLTHGSEITLSKLPVGYFLQVQETAPGYAAYVNSNRTDTATFQIAETNNSDINFINRPASVILNIKKTDKENSDPVAGAVFRLYNIVGGTQNTLFTLTSGADGFMTYTESGVTSRDISLENGTYYLAEQTAPGGYTPWADGERVTIVVDNTKPSDEQIVISGSTYATLTGPSEDRFLLTVTNERAIPAPTGMIFRTLPFVLMGILGATLFIGKARGRKEKDSDIKQDGKITQ